MLPSKYSFQFVSKKHIAQRFAAEQAVLDALSPTPSEVLAADAQVDTNKRSFLKLAGIAGAGLIASQMLPKKASAYVMGSTPTSNVVGVKNVANARINPAQEDGNLATINTNTAPFLVSNEGGFIQQDSSYSMARESGGNLASIATNTALLSGFHFDGSNNLKVVSSGGGGGGGAVTVLDKTSTQINPSTEDSVVLLRRLLRQVDSLGVIDSQQRQKVTIDSITGALTLATVTTVGTVSTVTTASNLTALGNVDGRFLYIDIARNTYANCIRRNLASS